ncbi:MAG: hypothetical protein DRP12_00050 [Candidatus Aenigmatarchaeota archaeon]|nr:MAG: hypothetical protein DRP12_00050 [Candidatus Aenigmarchaeota archaeon]
MIEIEPKRDEKGNIVRGVWIRKGLTETINETQLNIEISRLERAVDDLKARLDFLKRVRAEIERRKAELEKSA